MKFKTLDEVFSHGGVFQLDVLEPLSVVNSTRHMRWRAFYRIPIQQDMFALPEGHSDYKFVDGDTPSEAVMQATQLCVAARLRGIEA